MFKLKVRRGQKARVKAQLKIIETSQYDYVLTTDPEAIESDKINILFGEEHLDKVNKMLDSITKGEDTYILGYGEIGQKTIEARLIQYFIVEVDEVYAVLHQQRYLVKKKLYELEEMLKNKYFIRITKYALVNINMIDYIKPALNSKLNLLMKNGDELEVNRHYYKAFKKALHI